MGCQKVGLYRTEAEAQARIELIWREIREGTRDYRDHTPHAAVWCYAHHAWHLTSNGMKPKGRGKRGRLANGLRANDKRSRGRAHR